MLEKHCPYCQQPVYIRLLKKSNSHKAYLKREAFPCPECQKNIQLPTIAEKLLSIGLLFSVIVAPLLYYWRGTTIGSYLFFFIGLALIITGTIKNQLQPALPKSTSSDEKK